MHESGLIHRMLDLALIEATRHGSRLKAIHVRLGALAGGSPDHLRDHFEVELSERGMKAVRLEIHADPEYPGGIEITSVDLEAES